MLFNSTLSTSKWIFWYFHTLGYLNGSSFFNIHYRNLPIAPFNSELNFAHFWLKNSRLHEKLVGCPLRERVSKMLFPQKYSMENAAFSFLPNCPIVCLLVTQYKWLSFGGQRYLSCNNSLSSWHTKVL